MIESDALESELMAKFENHVKIQLEIVDLLNSLIESSFNDYHQKLNILDGEKLIIFTLTQNKIVFLEQTAYENEDNSEAILAITVFKIFFMNNNSFNLKDLDEKKKYFNLLLKLLKHENVDNNEFCYIQEILSKISESTVYSPLLKLIEENYDNSFYVFCFYAFLKYSGTKKIFYDSFLTFVKSEFKSNKQDIDLELRNDFSEKEIESISEKDLINDLLFIRKNIINYIILSIDNGHLKIEKMPPDQIKYMLDNKDGEPEIKKKNNNKKQRNKESSSIGNNIITYSKEQENNCINELGLDENVGNMKNKNSQENKDKTVLKAKSLEEESRNNQDNNNIFDRINEDGNNSQKELSIEDRLNQLLSMIQDLKERMKDKDNENNSLKEIINQNNKKHRKYQNIIKNYKKNIDTITRKAIGLEQDLGLIKMRDAFKNILDLFCKALGIPLDYSYNSKMKEIIKNERIKNTKIGDLVNFLKKIYFELKISNENAHSIKLNESILSQVFDYIDQDEKLNELKKVLEKGKIGDLLKKLAINRKIYCYDRKLMLKEEQKIMDEVKDLDDIFN